MKNFYFTSVSVVLVTFAAFMVKADYISEYNVGHIEDVNNYTDGVNFYQLFNNYFAEQLGGNTFSSSDDLFNARGVNSNTDWTSHGSSVVGAFKVAAMGHELNVFSKETNQALAGLLSVAGTENINNGGITDLTGPTLSLPDGQHLDFGLNASHNGDRLFTWSSDTELNEDGRVHMIALDITDLYNMKHDANFDSVFMFGWEDLSGLSGAIRADWDYQDFVAILTNITPASTATPEPATMLIFGFGSAALLPWARRKMTQKNTK